MTKQFKKGLIAVLVVLMAVLVGFTANSVIGASEATKKPPIVVEFERHVSQLSDLTEEQNNREYLFTGIVGENEANLAEAQNVWNAYNSAKLLINDLSKYADVNEIDAALRVRFEKYDAIIDGKEEGEMYSAFGHLGRFRDTMKTIAEGWKPYTTYDSAHQLVTDLGTDIAAWEANKATPGNIYYYINYSSTVDTEYYEYYRALKVMQDYEAKFEEIGKLVGAIEYYDEDALTMKGSDVADTYDPANEKQKIVLASETSINAVTEALKDVAEADKKYIKDPNGADDTEGKTLATYNAAKDAFEALGKSVDKVITDIETAFAAKKDVEKEEIYYTVRDLIKVAEDGYNALVAESRYEGGVDSAENYNDLATKVSNFDKLDEMLKYLKNLDEKEIPDVEKLIDAIPALNEASYTVAYRTAIEEAEAAIDALDNDIKEHDAKVYAIKTEIAKANAKIAEMQAKFDEINAKRTAEGYDQTTDAAKADDDKYLEEYNEYVTIVDTKTEELKFDDAYMFNVPEGQDYIVRDYDKLMDSRAQHEAWTAYIRGLIEKVELIIDRQQNNKGEGVAELLAELEAPYTNIGAPWQGKETKYHKSAFFYAAEKDGDVPIYIEDEKYGTKYDFLIESPYPPKDVEGKVTAYEVLSYFYKIKSEIYTKVNDIEREIKNLAEAAAAAGCVYGERDVLLDIWDKYSALESYVPAFDPNGEPMDLRNWISNHAQLEAMYNEFVAEDALVKVWAEALKALDEEPVSVAKFEAIAKVEEAFKAIAHQAPKAEEPTPVAEEPAETPADPVVTADFGAFLAEAGMAKHGDFVLDYSAEWAKYEKIIASRDLLKKTIDELAENEATAEIDSMIEIDTDDSENLLPLDQVIDWTNAVNAITARYEAIADMVKDAENKDVANIDTVNNIDYTGAQAYLQKNHGAAYANYVKALRLIERYEVEAAIEELPAAADVTLADVEKINKAWTMHDDYLKKYHTSEAENTDEWRETPPHNDFRNDQKLHDCLDKINQINQELNAWMREVVALYEEIADDANLTVIKEALVRGEEFIGYPLDLDAWKAVSDKYAPLVGEDADKAAYVEQAKTVLDGLNAKSDEVIADLNARIKAISDKINGVPATDTTPAVEPQELTAEDIQEVSDIQELYNKLHKTQQDKIVGYNDVLLDARDTLVAVESFKSMVDALYTEVVTNKNVTSYVQFYIDIVKTTYAQFAADIRLSFDDAENVNYIKPNGYTKNLEEIQAAYDAALEAGTVVRLSELKAEFDKAQADLIAALNGLSSLAESDTTNALKEAFTNFENRITAAYTKAIEDKATALKTELQGLIDAEKAAREAGDTKLANDLAAAKTELEGKITAAQTALEAAIAKEASDRVAALDAVNAKVDALKTDIEAKLTAQINALKTELQGLIKAEEDARKAGETAAADALKAAREALEKSIKAAEDAIAKEASDRAAALADVITKVNAAQSAADSAQEAVNKLKADMEKADAELKKQIEDIKSTTSTLTILVIVLAVMVLASLACIIILFIKRK